MKNRYIILIALFSCIAGALYAPPITAKFGKPQLDEVPIARLVENLDKLAAADPNNVALRIGIARAHAMAYASKLETCSVLKNKEGQGPWFGPIENMKAAPFTIYRPKDEAQLKVAHEHLNKAIERYKEAVKLEGKNLFAKLGLAWCLDQAQKKEEAIKAYRDVIEESWKQDSKRKNNFYETALTIEAAGYLIPLLDKTKDQKEIVVLQERVTTLKNLPRSVTPIVVPLREGLTAYDMVNDKARVPFDVDGRGFKDEWTWFTKDAGILVYDPNGKRNITSGIQLFGAVTFWMFWDNGYEALRALDDNGDGDLTGKELDGIAVWIDANGDGVCQPGEIKTLTELGIVTLSCRYQIDLSHPDRVPFSTAGVTFRDGRTRTTFDVYLRKW